MIGAGLAGVLAGSLLPLKVPGLKLTILEKNADVVSFHISPASIPHFLSSVIFSAISEYFDRAVRGSRTSTLAFDVIFPPTSINPALNPTRNGLKLLPKVRRFRLTGLAWLGSIMFTIRRASTKR